MMLAGRDWRARRGTGDTDSKWIRPSGPLFTKSVRSQLCGALGPYSYAASRAAKNMACCGVGAKSGPRSTPKAMHCAQCPIATVQYLQAISRKGTIIAIPSIILYTSLGVSESTTLDVKRTAKAESRTPSANV